MEKSRGVEMGKTDTLDRYSDKPDYIIKADIEEKEAWDAYLKAVANDKCERTLQAFRKWSYASNAKVDAYHKWAEESKE